VLTELKFGNFRGFSSFAAAFKPITVLVGANSSGKTSVLHAARMVIEALDLALEHGIPHAQPDGGIAVCKNIIVDDFARLVPVDDWVELFKGAQVAEGSKLTVEATFDGQFKSLAIAIEYGRNRQPKLTVDAVCPLASAVVHRLRQKSPERHKMIANALKEHAPRAFLVPAFYGVTRAEEHRSHGLIHRLLGGGEQSRVVRNLVTRLPKDRFDGLNAFLRRATGATLTWRTSGDETDRALHLKVYFKDSNGELELSSAGAGLVNLVALYASMAYFRATEDPRQGLIYLLDEPEAHLHPKLQGDVGAAIAALAREFGAQVIMATHAVEIVNRVGERDDALLLAVNRRAEFSSTPLDSEQDIVRELAQYCDLTPFTSLNFLASRRVLFHEGPSDAAILTACARIYLRNKPDESQRFRRWTFVSLDGVGNVSAQAVLGSVLSPRIFPNLSEKRKVRAVCVLDRDAERIPGRRAIQNLSNEQFEAVEQIWSRYSIESLFLDTDCLFAWIRLRVPVGVMSDGDLQIAVEAAKQEADRDQNLDDAAVDAIERVELRKGGKTLAEAKKEARACARAEPTVWQRGRARAGFMLGLIRKSLPTGHQNKVRSTLADLVEIPLESIQSGDIDRLVPKELRDLLDWLVTKS